MHPVRAESGHSVLQCVAVCCAICCSVLQSVTVCCSVLQCVVVYCGMLQSVAVRCSALQCEKNKSRHLCGNTKALQEYTSASGFFFLRDMTCLSLMYIECSAPRCCKKTCTKKRVCVTLLITLCDVNCLFT